MQTISITVLCTWLLIATTLAVEVVDQQETKKKIFQPAVASARTFLPQRRPLKDNNYHLTDVSVPWRHFFGLFDVSMCIVMFLVIWLLFITSSDSLDDNVVLSSVVCH